MRRKLDGGMGGKIDWGNEVGGWKGEEGGFWGGWKECELGEG